VVVAPEGRRLLRLEARNSQVPIEKKPPWIKARLRTGPEYLALKDLVRRQGLHKVCPTLPRAGWPARRSGQWDERLAGPGAPGKISRYRVYQATWKIAGGMTGWAKPAAGSASEVAPHHDRPGTCGAAAVCEDPDGSLAHAPGFVLTTERRSSSWV
jgi:hypothetical protein